MTKWEYQIITDEKKLDELGYDGWELVAVVQSKAFAGYQFTTKYYLKRIIR